MHCPTTGAGKVLRRLLKDLTEGSDVSPKSPDCQPRRDRGSAGARAARPRHRQRGRVCAATMPQALHVQLADAAVALDATGPSAYLDVAALIAIARGAGLRCGASGLRLPERARRLRAGLRRRRACASSARRREQLALFGDKARARALAAQCDVPVMPGSAGAVTLARGAGLLRRAAGARARASWSRPSAAAAGAACARC